MSCFPRTPWLPGVDHVLDSRYRNDDNGEVVTTEGTFVIEGIDERHGVPPHVWCRAVYLARLVHGARDRVARRRAAGEHAARRQLHGGAPVRERRRARGRTVSEGDGPVTFELRLTEGTEPLDGDALIEFADELADVAGELRALAAAGR